MWVIEDSIKRVVLSVSLINTCKFDREHLLTFVCFKHNARGPPYRLNEHEVVNYLLPYKEELLRTPTILFITLVSI